MRSRHFLAAGLGVVALNLGAPAQQAFAHHCFAAVFDAEAPIELKGRIITVEWVNPHAKIHVAGAEAGQPAQNWMFWASTPNTLLRLGLSRDALEAGTEVTVRGYKAKDRSCPESAATGAAACKGDGRELILSDDRSIRIASGGDGGPGGGPCTWRRAPTPAN